ncbi:hypothetical protein FGO68_gene15154 [Halteria grandinella]|uniref:Uncharacterized protein n=1 Tax=Halteria grandinella TaxID=5974 RepID=A0A8J8NJB2_HALGN|nr:hypothetical protein FGO68_gene15154 [Halteria grandinella]
MLLLSFLFGFALAHNYTHHNHSNTSSDPAEPSVARSYYHRSNYYNGGGSHYYDPNCQYGCTINKVCRPNDDCSNLATFLVIGVFVVGIIMMVIVAALKKKKGGQNGAARKEQLEKLKYEQERQQRIEQNYQPYSIPASTYEQPSYTVTANAPYSSVPSGYSAYPVPPGIPATPSYGYQSQNPYA